MRAIIYGLIIGILFLVFSFIVTAQEPDEDYYPYLGDYPAHGSPGWHQDVQRVTHDDANWFIVLRAFYWTVKTGDEREAWAIALASNSAGVR